MKFEDIQVITRSRDPQVLPDTKNEAGAEHKLYIKDELNQSGGVMFHGCVHPDYRAGSARFTITMVETSSSVIMSKVKPRRR